MERRIPEFFDIRKEGSESVKTLCMYVVELKTLLKEFNEVERGFGVRNMLSCDQNTVHVHSLDLFCL